MGNSDRWRAIVWEWSDLDPTTRLVALAIAEHANAAGECWPGRVTLARMTGLSEKSITRSLAKLRGRIDVTSKRRGRPEKNSKFRFVKGTESPINGAEKGQSGLEKGTIRARKRDSQSAYNENHYLTSVEPSKLSANPPTQSDHARLMEHHADRIGYVGDGAAQGKAIKRLLGRFSVEDLIACYEYQTRELRANGGWRDSVSWLTVSKSIGEWAAAGKPAVPPRKKNDGKRTTNSDAIADSRDYFAEKYGRA